MQSSGDNSMRARMAETRLACEREIPIHQQRIDSLLTFSRDRFDSAKSEAQRTIQLQEKLGNLKGELREAEDALVKALSVSRRGEEEEDNSETKVRPGLPPGCFSFEPDAVVVPRKGADRRVDVMVAAAVTVVLGVGNRVLYKLALVPLKHYPFFLAQLAK